MATRLLSSRNLSQIAQLITNVEFFQVACTVLEDQLIRLRATQRGGSIRLQSSSSFSALHARSVAHLTVNVNAKLSDFFGMAEYDWTPKESDGTPSFYMWDMINWLTTVVDGLSVREEVKEQLYKGALAHTADSLMGFLVGQEVAAINENGLRNLLLDVDFLEGEFKKLGKANLTNVFSELRATIAIPMRDDVSSFMTPSERKAAYPNVQPRRLASLLNKMARFGLASRIRAEQEKGEKIGLEAQAVSRMAA